VGADWAMAGVLRAADAAARLAPLTNFLRFMTGFLPVLFFMRVQHISDSTRRPGCRSSHRCGRREVFAGFSATKPSASGASRRPRCYRGTAADGMPLLTPLS
jgi:hypothetical protein